MTPADPPPATQVLEALWRYFAPPPDAPPTDELEALVDRFVELKQRLGAKYQSQWRVLFRFLRHMESRGIIHVQQLTPEILRDWADSRRHLAPTTFDHEIRQVCVLLDHFKTLGKIKDNPAEFLKVRIRHNHVPYVFALEELARIFVPAGAGRFDEDHALIWRFTYACGLRAQEAAHLGIGGHSSVEHTQVYLKITAVLLREAAHRFSTRLEGEFPLSP